MIIYILILLCYSAFGQTINKAVYSIRLKPPKKNTRAKKDLTSILIVSAKAINYELFFNKENAIYKNTKTLKSEAKKTSINLTKIFAGGGHTYFTSKTKNVNSFYTFQEDNETFLVTYPSIEWVLKNETKKIGNYICYKALGSITSVNQKNTITAWFCPEIPFHFGPKNYNGLPGLIIEIENKVGTFKLTKLILASKEKIDFTKPKGITITEKEYYNRISTMFYNK